MIDDAIKISKIVFMQHPRFKTNTDLLCWCLFEKYIKYLDENVTYENFNTTLRVADFIIENAENSNGTAYSYTINCIIRFLKNKTKYMTVNVLAWLDKIDVDGLSGTPIVYQSNNREGMSEKERYFSLKSKVLLNLREYEKCISVCDKGLNDLSVFHYENDIWFEARKAKCFIALNRFEEALALLKKIILVKDHWSFFDDISKIYMSKNSINDALIYLCRALITNDKPEMKVNLYERMGILLEILREDQMALKHYLISRKIRKEQEWNLSDTLDNNISELVSKLNDDGNCEMYVLRNYWNKKLIELLGEKRGRISNIIANGNAGFIKANDNSYYFKMSSILGNRNLFKTGIEVRFCTVDSYDRAKSQYSKEAICVCVASRPSA